MASLKETKNRIASVRSTLKITSAMKLVASAKLRKAQAAIEGMLPYKNALTLTLERALDGGSVPESMAKYYAKRESGKVVLIVVSSNTSLCGAFNANVIRTARERIADLRAEGRAVEVYSIGRKAADSMRLLGYPSPGDFHSLSDKPNYEGAASIAESLMEAFAEGRIDGVEILYNHFVSTSSQKVLRETFLPLSEEKAGSEQESQDTPEERYIFEPGKEGIIEELLPKTMKLKLFSALLDSLAAEHAARTVAMQTASDNAENLLRELSLEYNKGRQQKITSEILDLASGAERD